MKESRFTWEQLPKSGIVVCVYVYKQEERKKKRVLWENDITHVVLWKSKLGLEEREDKRELPTLTLFYIYSVCVYECVRLFVFRQLKMILKRQSR